MAAPIRRSREAGAEGRAEEVVSGGLFPFFLGGDHSISIGTVSGVARPFGGRTGGIWLDALRMTVIPLIVALLVTGIVAGSFLTERRFPMVAGVLLPGMALVGLILAPYTDRNPSNKPEDRKFAVSLFTLFLIFWAVLVIIGTFFRGPGFNFIFPWNDGLFVEL